MVALAATGALLIGCTTAPPAQDAAPVCPATPAPATSLPPATPSATSGAGAAAPAAGEFVLPPPGSQVLVFGDSYTQSTGATCPQTGYAARLAATFGWVADVQGFGGTGFVARGVIDADYLARLSALTPTTPALVMVQGGLNDALAGATEEQELTAARAVLDLLARTYPDSQVVVLGPPQVQVVDAAVIAGINRALRRASIEHQVPYLNPLGDGWDVQRFTTADGLHPDDAGHEHLAARVAAALRELAR